MAGTTSVPLSTESSTAFPDAAIGVDTLIGFPGETDAAFGQTYELIASLPVAYLHVFPLFRQKGYACVFV